MGMTVQFDGLMGLRSISDAVGDRPDPIQSVNVIMKVLGSIAKIDMRLRTSSFHFDHARLASVLTTNTLLILNQMVTRFA